MQASLNISSNKKLLTVFKEYFEKYLKLDVYWTAIGAVI